MRKVHDGTSKKAKRLEVKLRCILRDLVWADWNELSITREDELIGKAIVRILDVIMYEMNKK